MKKTRAIIKKATGLIDDTLASLEYIKALSFLFGIGPEKIPFHIGLTAELSNQKEAYREILDQMRLTGKRALLLNQNDIIPGLKKILREVLKEKRRWKIGRPVKVVCPDKELIGLAYEFLERQAPYMFRKDEIHKYFDVTAAFPFWGKVPNYTMILIGGGMFLSSPEYDLFRMMCYFYDEALRAQRELEKIVQTAETEGTLADDFYQVQPRYRTMCTQAVLNSFLVLEAYLNSLAHLYLAEEPDDLNEDTGLYLTERVKDKKGNVRQKFVSIQEKLHEWIRIFSQRGETFDKGKRPFQDFMELKKYRDAVVHLSESKVPLYNYIGFDIAKKSVFTVIELIEKIGEFIAQVGDEPEQPWWLAYPNESGFFNLPHAYMLPEAED